MNFNNNGIIYKITNKTTGKSYIGKTIQNINARWNNHIKNAINDPNPKTKFYRALKKYGQENFIIETIETASAKKLNELEIFYIKLHDTYHNGYNGTEGGEGGRFKHTPEAIEKIRQASTGKRHTQETKDKLSLMKTGIKFSKTHKDNLKKNHKGMLGKIQSPETKRKIGEKNQKNMLRKKLLRHFNKN